jgi:beta-lactamase regulating signal transducer with metallopeptidase domain/tetratricopeptide (TPR) repeat protein
MHLTLNSTVRFAADVALKATFLFVVTGVLQLLLRRGSAAARHLIGTVGLAAALLLPVLSLALSPRIAVPFLPDVRPGSTASEAAPVPDGGPFAGTPAARYAWWARLAVSVPEKPLEGPLESLESRRSLASAPAGRIAPTTLGLTVALGAWLLGALAVAARLFVGWLRVRRIARGAAPIRDADWIEERDALALRLSVERAVELRESPSVPIAMTSGLLKPLLLLGRAARLWAVERRRVVLLHELAHVKRFDWAAVLVAELAVALYWFHPLAWWIGRRVRRDAERASDDLVISSGVKPSVYAGHLLGLFRSMATPAHPVAPALAAVRPSHFEERLRAILDPRALRVWQPTGAARWAAAGLLIVAAGVTVVEPWKPASLKCASARSASCTAASSPRLAPSTLETPVTAERTPSGEFQAAAAAEDSSEAAAVSESASESDPGVSTLAQPDAVVHAVRSDEPTPAEGFVQASNGERKRDGSDWYGRGMQLHRDDRYPEAIESFRKALDAGYREDATSYNIACGYALMGNADAAFEWLQRARDAGFDLAAYLCHDDDLVRLRTDKRWADLKKSARDRKADRKVEEGRAVAARLERLVAKAPKNGEGFFQIGRELLKFERYDLAVKAYQAAVDRGYRTGTSLYNQACALSLGGDVDGALDRLAKALDAGFDQPEIFRTDEDLDAVRGDTRFAKLARDARDLSLPSHGMGRWEARGSRSKWREKVKRSEEYARAHPDEGRAWFNLGLASLAAERPDAAAEAFHRAVDLNYRKPTTMYNLACAYSHMDQKDAAFECLFRSLEAGFDETGTLRTDEDLDNLRGDPRYRKALEIARARERGAEKD